MRQWTRVLFAAAAVGLGITSSAIAQPRELHHRHDWRDGHRDWHARGPYGPYPYGYGPYPPPPVVYGPPPAYYNAPPVVYGAPDGYP